MNGATSCAPLVGWGLSMAVALATGQIKPDQGGLLLSPLQHTAHSERAAKVHACTIMGLHVVQSIDVGGA